MSETLTHAVVLILVANGAPVLAWRFLPGWAAWPLDGGRCWGGRRLLGDSKTWRGVLAAVAATALVSALLGVGAGLGALAGAAAMLGDVLSSLIKRRFGVLSSGRALGLDQMPEALLPACVLAPELALSFGDIALVLLLFFALELLLSQILFRFGLRKRPY